MQHLTQCVVAFRNARDWAQFHGLKDEALSLLVEAGEVSEDLFGIRLRDQIGADVRAYPEGELDAMVTAAARTT